MTHIQSELEKQAIQADFILRTAYNINIDYLDANAIQEIQTLLPIILDYRVRKEAQAKLEAPHGIH